MGIERCSSKFVHMAQARDQVNLAKCQRATNETRLTIGAHNNSALAIHLLECSEFLPLIAGKVSDKVSKIQLKSNYTKFFASAACAQFPARLTQIYIDECAA